MEDTKPIEERKRSRKIRITPCIPDKWEERCKRLSFELSSKENTIQRLKAANEELRDRFYSLEESKLREVINLKNHRDDLKLQYYQAKIDCMGADASRLELLATRPAPVVVINQSMKNVCEAETLQTLQEQVLEVKGENSALKNTVQLLQKNFAATVADTSQKVQEAIRDNADTCSKLVEEYKADHDKLLEKYKREIVKRKALHDALVELRGNIRVYLRPKPLDDSEDVGSVFMYDSYDDTTISVPSKGRRFQLEKVFAHEASQADVFSEVSALIQSVIDGHNVCIFAYGQTGSGKTHTMEGSCEDPGVNQRALRLLHEATQGSVNVTYQLNASMMEIYNETIRDLLSPDPSEKLEVKMKPEGGLHVPGLVSVPVESITEINRIAKVAQENRATASTVMNERSSRSHCVLCVSVEETNLITGTMTKGRLNLVDLAGSERVSKSQVEGARLKEAQSINRSLSCLGDVINALKNHHTHIPYRNSKLTYLLQESLGGDSKTVMILQASSHPDNLNETLSTLTFGQRAFSVELNSKNQNTPSSARRPVTDTPTTGQRKMLLSDKDTPTGTGGSTMKTPSSLVKASSVPSRLNFKK